MAPQQLSRLRQNTHLGEMLGAWAGRQAEEELAVGFNGLLVDRTLGVWTDGMKEGRKEEFVNIADPNLKDPVLIDAWKMVPKESKDYMEIVAGGRAHISFGSGRSAFLVWSHADQDAGHGVVPAFKRAVMAQVGQKLLGNATRCGNAAADCVESFI
jgi:hypothetical protein